MGFDGARDVYYQRASVNDSKRGLVLICNVEVRIKTGACEF